MGLGILDDKHLQHVPGTSVFSDDVNATALKAYEGIDLDQLKHAKGKNAHIVLVPQPSDDPNDPLNWPQWKKHMVHRVFPSLFGQSLISYRCSSCGAFDTAIKVVFRLMITLY